MQTHKVSFSGASIVDRHTHYEVAASIGPYSATIVIPGYVEQEFFDRYGLRITACERLDVQTDFFRNGQRDRECQDPFRSPMHLFGNLTSLDEIVAYSTGGKAPGVISH
jgi:hypothetical protein